MESPKNSESSSKLYAWFPFFVSVAVVFGILIGDRFNDKGPADLDRKLNSVLNLVADDYVDEVDLHDLVEGAIPGMLSKLDPHSVYIPASELRSANEELEGSFCGVGIEFSIINDSITVLQVIHGGPAEAAGLLRGDKITTIDGKSAIGYSNDKVRSSLRGAPKSKVKIVVERRADNKKYNYTITRGEVPVKSVDSYYMIDKTIGYIKVENFGRNTYDEFYDALGDLQLEGAENFIIDLRGNSGGYMERAVYMVNEFLKEGKLIVFTKGRDKRNDQEIWSDGTGSFLDAEVVVLIDELSASASEIFAGAIQDNDRGLIVGCRSFGKGLVQRQFMLSDTSAIRLTISRYYTPSGRSIQKDYKEYNDDMSNRYNHGEIFSKDSIKVDSTKVFLTATGRKVYGGGGIIPDIFVPRDTIGNNPYYRQVYNAGLLQEYARYYIGKNYRKYNGVKDYKQLLRTLPSNDALISDFATYAATNGVPARWYYINLARTELVTDIKALIGRSLLGSEAFYPIYNRNDKTIDAALKAFIRHETAFPIKPGYDKPEQSTRTKKSSKKK